MVTVLVAGLAFLIGSFPAGVVLTRAITGTDVRQHGSGNIGAANVTRTVGLKLGIAVLVLDMLKGSGAVGIGLVAGLDHAELALVALAAVLGHDFSLFLRFQGGKGVATTLGVALVLAPLATLLGIVTFLLVMAIWRYASLASLTALAALPLFVAITGGTSIYVVLYSVLFTVSIGRHWENIVRLAHGQESKFGRHGR